MLTDIRIRNAEPREKPYKLYDGGGLYILINPTGSLWWRMKYRYHGKERGLALGVYPAVTLKEARERRDENRRLLSRHVDPIESRRQERLAAEITFKLIAEEQLALQTAKLTAKTLYKARWILESFLYRALAERPIAAITAPELLSVLRPIEKKGHNETAHRALQRCSQIFRYAVATGRATRDITTDLRGALAPIVTTSHAALIEPKQIGALMRAIDGYDGHPVTAIALKLAPLVFVRPGELRAAQWSEVDLLAAEWRIPGDRMKTGRRHIVPLASQALALLRELKRLTGAGRYLFPSLRSRERPMSNNTINAALRRMGYSGEEMTGHGFRTTASTSLNEQGWHPDIIELQLAHAERNKVRAVYNRAERLADRRKMMQAWADYLDALRTSHNVVPIARTA